MVPAQPTATAGAHAIAMVRCVMFMGQGCSVVSEPSATATWSAIERDCSPTVCTNRERPTRQATRKETRRSRGGQQARKLETSLILALEPTVEAPALPRVPLAN